MKIKFYPGPDQKIGFTLILGNEGGNDLILRLPRTYVLGRISGRCATADEKK